MRHLLVLAIALAGCGELTDGETLGTCAKSTREWWPVSKGARWTWRVTQFRATAPSPAPEFGLKEHRILEESVAIGGLLGDERGFQMRVVDELDEETETLEWVTEEDRSYRWRRKLFTNSTVATPTRDRYYEPWSIKLDYRPDRLCANSHWEESWENVNVCLDPLCTQSRPVCPLDTWRSSPESCAATTASSWGTWGIASVDATLSLFEGQTVFPHALCTFEQGDDKNSIDCYVEDIGKVYECETNPVTGRVEKVEELCAHCFPDESDDCVEMALTPLCSEVQEGGRTCDDVFRN